MHCKPFTPLVVAGGVLLALVSVMPVRPSAEVSNARVVHVEGSTRKVEVRDWNGQMVEVIVPSQSLEDIRTSPAEPRDMRRTAGQDKGTVMATVVSVDEQNNRVTVRTQQGQTLVLETPARDIQVGEKLALVVP